jgi:hypothetical protein
MILYVLYRSGVVSKKKAKVPTTKRRRPEAVSKMSTRSKAPPKQPRITKKPRRYLD